MKLITNLFTGNSRRVRQVRVQIALWLSVLLTGEQLLKISGVPAIAGAATNEVRRPGYNIAVVASNPTTPTSGTPLRVGSRTGIAMEDKAAGGAGSTETVAYMGPGEFTLTVDDDLGTAIAVGDALYYHDTQTGTPATSINNRPGSTGIYFGFALATVSANATTSIRVFHDPGVSHPGVGLKVAVINGGAAGALTVTGISTKDRLVSVLVFTTAASIATLADLTSEFTITAADTIDNTAGTSTASNRVVVIYEDATP